MPKHYDLSEQAADLETLARQVQGLAIDEKKKQHQRQIAATPHASQPKWMRSSLTKGIFFGAVVSLAVMWVLLQFHIVPGFGQANAQKIAVPELLGQNIRGAKSALNNLGLKVTIKHQYSKDKAQGTVLALKPVGGTKIAPDSEVTLYVSDKSKASDSVASAPTQEPSPALPIVLAAASKEKLPDVEGMVDAKARTTLDKLQLGLTITITQKQDAAQPDRIVLASDPKPGTPIAKGDTVHLVVNSLVAPEEPAAPPSDGGLVPVPDYAGRGGTDTVNDLQRLGFTAIYSTVHSRLQSPGYVVKTDPSAGSKLPHGSAVKVIVAGE